MFYDTLKRALDILASLILTILFLPVWIIVPILIKLDSHGPIFFFQERIGKKGKIFRIMKFRSMKMFEIEGQEVHAVDFWKHNKKLYEKYKKAGWKLTLEKDPRITKLGRVLRQTSIDEFPQIFNILKGDMSLVGPRPIRQVEVADAVERYGIGIRKTVDMSLTVKPGLTGLWQVSGRNDIPWDQRVEMDAGYAKRRSFLEDFVIMVKTPFAMISKW